MSIYLTIGIIVLIALIGVAVSASSQARSAAMQQKESPDSQLDDIRKMYQDGEIDEEEFKRMKKIIANKMVESTLKDNRS